MRRLTLADRILLFGLVPFWILAQIVHFDRQTGELPLAWFPAYVSPAAGAGEFPSVLQLWPETPVDSSTLRPGDRLVSLGGESLEGVGRLGVITRAFPAADAAGLVAFTVERDGQPVAATLELKRVPAPAGHLLLSLSMGLSATLVLLRGRGARTARAYGLAALVYSLHFSSIYGGAPWQTAFGLWLVIGTGALHPPLTLRTALMFPENARARSRWAFALPWILLLNGFALYVWILGAPSLGLFGFRLVGICVAVHIVAFLGILIRNYAVADARGRRQMKWGVYGFVVGTLPPMVASAGASAVPELRGVYEASLGFQVVFPACMFIALVRDNLFDINRLITTTAAYTLVAPLFVGALFQVVPPLANWASVQTGLQSNTILWVLAMALAAPVPVAARWLRPILERWFFREQFRIELALRDLRAKISELDGPAGLLEVLGEDLGERLDVETSAVYARAGEAFVPVSARGPVVPPGFAADGALAALVAEADGPVIESRWQRWARRGLLPDSDRASLESLGANVILAVRRSERLEAFVCLGDKLSGELYSRAELALLESLAERVSLELEATDQKAIDDEERRLYEQLARYAPGSVAEEIRRGADIEPGEREVTVLFVDIRGYTQMSQSRRAPEIFRVVNAYTTAVSRQVRDHGGAVVEFHGDGLMAAFGAPADLADKERCAVEAARAIVKAVETDAFGERGEVELSVGVGIATGPAFVGNIQSIDRQIWGVIGNTTNLAARLEGKTRDLDVSVVLDDVTYERSGEAGTEFVRRNDVHVKGRDEAFTIWTLGRPETSPRPAERV